MLSEKSAYKIIWSMVAIILNIYNQRKMTRNTHIGDCELIISRWVGLCVIFVYFSMFLFSAKVLTV